jgi:hypothetical protein
VLLIDSFSPHASTQEFRISIAQRHFSMREAPLLSSEEIQVNAIAATARLNRSS